MRKQPPEQSNHKPPNCKCQPCLCIEENEYVTRLTRSFNFPLFSQLLTTQVSRQTVMVILFYAIAIAVFQAAFGQGAGQVILTTVRCMLIIMLIFLHTIAIAVRNVPFGQGTGPVLQYNVRCTGTESSLLNCSHDVVHPCSHSSDAGVVCPPCKSCRYVFRYKWFKLLSCCHWC